MIQFELIPQETNNVQFENLYWMAFSALKQLSRDRFLNLAFSWEFFVDISLWVKWSWSSFAPVQRNYITASLKAPSSRMGVTLRILGIRDNTVHTCSCISRTNKQINISHKDVDPCNIRFHRPTHVCASRRDTLPVAKVGRSGKTGTSWGEIQTGVKYRNIHSLGDMLHLLN